MHSLLQTWLDTQLREHLDLLYQWSSSVLGAIKFAQLRMANHLTMACQINCPTLANSRTITADIVDHNRSS
jgi:hypothetical protein